MCKVHFAIMWGRVVLNVLGLEKNFKCGGV